MDQNKKYLLAVFGVFVVIGTLVYIVYASSKDDRPVITQKEEAHRVDPYASTQQQEVQNIQQSTSSAPNTKVESNVSTLKGLTKKDMTIDEKLAVKQPEMVINTSKKYEITLKTSAGDITMDMFADKVPLTVNNFVYLSSIGFYKDTIFHRVIKDFMIQGGDPKGDGTGGPSYRIQDEKFDGEYKRGAVAMARTALPNSGGSQFFIMHKDTPLPKDYVIFGQVTKGLEVVDKIANAETVLNEAEGVNSKPKDPVKVLDVVVTEK